MINSQSFAPFTSPYELTHDAFQVITSAVVEQPADEDNRNEQSNRLQSEICQLRLYGSGVLNSPQSRQSTESTVSIRLVHLSSRYQLGYDCTYTHGPSQQCQDRDHAGGNLNGRPNRDSDGQLHLALHGHPNRGNVLGGLKSTRWISFQWSTGICTLTYVTDDGKEDKLWARKKKMSERIRIIFTALLTPENNKTNGIKPHYQYSAISLENASKQTYQ